MPHLHAALSGAIEFFKQKTAYFLFRSEQAIRFSATGPLVTFVLPSLGIGGAEIVSTALAKELVNADTSSTSSRWETLMVLRRSCPRACATCVSPVNISAVCRFPSPDICGARSRGGPHLDVADHLGLHRRAPFCALARAIFTWTLHLSVQYASRGALHRRLLRMSIARTYPLAHARIVVSKGAAEDLAAFSACAQLL